MVAFSRWRVERCFEDHKSEIGMDQFKGRRYLGLKRHLILSAVSYLFLARVRQEWAKRKRVHPTKAYFDSCIARILSLKNSWSRNP